MRSSFVSGPYASAVSMKLTPSSTARRKTFFAPSRSGGQPQIPSPVNRIAPKPSRLTNRSPPSSKVESRASGTAARILCNPPVRTPAALAESAAKNVRRVTSLCIEFPFLLHNSSFFLRRILQLKHQLHRQKSPPRMLSVSRQVKYVAAINSQLALISRSDLWTRWQWDSLRSDPRFQKIVAAPEPQTIH